MINTVRETTMPIRCIKCEYELGNCDPLICPECGLVYNVVIKANNFPIKRTTRSEILWHLSFYTMGIISVVLPLVLAYFHRPGFAYWRPGYCIVVMSMTVQIAAMVLRLFMRRIRHFDLVSRTECLIAWVLLSWILFNVM